MRTLADIKSELATPEEVAEATPFTVQTIQRMLRRGEIPGTKWGGRWFVNVPRLSEQLAGNHIVPGVSRSSAGTPPSGDPSRTPVPLRQPPSGAVSRSVTGRVSETPVPAGAAEGSATLALPSARSGGDLHARFVASSDPGTAGTSAVSPIEPLRSRGGFFASGGTMANPLLLDLDPAAEELSIGRTTLYKLIREGRIRTVMIGRRRLIERTELDRFVAHLRDSAVGMTPVDLTAGNGPQAYSTGTDEAGATVLVCTDGTVRISGDLEERRRVVQALTEAVGLSVVDTSRPVVLDRPAI